MGSKQSKNSDEQTAKAAPEVETISVCSKMQNIKCVPQGIFCCTKGGNTVVVSKSKNVSIKIDK